MKCILTYKSIVYGADTVGKGGGDQEPVRVALGAGNRHRAVFYFLGFYLNHQEGFCSLFIAIFKVTFCSAAK
jgi:hypothetical protein